jgi:hypothetical protein
MGKPEFEARGIYPLSDDLRDLLFSTKVREAELRAEKAESLLAKTQLALNNLLVSLLKSGAPGRDGWAVIDDAYNAARDMIIQTKETE